MTKTPTAGKPTPTAADFMSHRVRTVTSDMPLEEVVSYLLKQEISNAPVIDGSADGKRLVGFISERDCLEFLSNEAFHGSPAPPHRAETIMRKHPICVAPDTELFVLVSIFVNHGYRHLPVTENEELVGIVSRRDVLRALDRHYREYAADDPKHRPRPDPSTLSSYRFRGIK